MPHLVGDVLAVADVFDASRFHIVGHDWGSIVSWATAGNVGERVLSLSALSVPHPAAFQAALADANSDQQSRSFYFLLFRTPVVGEVLVRTLTIMELMYGDSHTEEEFHLNRQLFGDADILTGALRWYRALDLNGDGDTETVGKVNTPTLMIWGNQDPAIARTGVEDTRNWVSADYQFIELDAGHWLMQEQPDAVIGAIAQHIDTHSAVRAQ